MLNLLLFNLFLTIRFPIQWRIKHFSFDINLVSSHGNILKKLCDRHHTSIFKQAKTKITGYLAFPVFSLTGFTFHWALKIFYTEMSEKVDAEMTWQMHFFGLSAMNIQLVETKNF